MTPADPWAAVRPVPPIPAPPRRARRASIIAAGMLLLAAAIGLVGEPHPAHSAAHPTSCVHTIMDRTLVRLGESPRRWRVQATTPGTWGNTLNHPGPHDPYWVMVSPSVPCQYVQSVVTHEWMHTWQFRTGRTADLEMVADCGSMMLGSTYHPYVDRAGGCTRSEIEQAAELITIARTEAPVQ